MDKYPGDSAQTIIHNADCFVMVSSREAFGLVYVEAMAKGCIVIATKGQGMDGIIKTERTASYASQRMSQNWHL